MNIVNIDNILTIVLSFIFGSGITCWLAKAILEKIVRDSLKKEMEEILEKQKEIEEKTMKKISQIEKDYVTCAYCNMQTENTHRLFGIIDTKLNTIIDHSIR